MGNVQGRGCTASWRATEPAAMPTTSRRPTPRATASSEPSPPPSRMPAACPRRPWTTSMLTVPSSRCSFAHGGVNLNCLVGTSTKKNDHFETVAFKSFFGDHARKLKISSIKGVTGHSLGAAGGFEAIACVKTLETGRFFFLSLENLEFKLSFQVLLPLR